MVVKGQKVMATEAADSTLRRVASLARAKAACHGMYVSSTRLPRPFSASSPAQHNACVHMRFPPGLPKCCNSLSLSLSLSLSPSLSACPPPLILLGVPIRLPTTKSFHTWLACKRV